MQFAIIQLMSVKFALLWICSAYEFQMLWTGQTRSWFTITHSNRDWTCLSHGSAMREALLCRTRYNGYSEYSLPCHKPLPQLGIGLICTDFWYTCILWGRSMCIQCKCYTHSWSDLSHIMLTYHMYRNVSCYQGKKERVMWLEVISQLAAKSCTNVSDLREWRN